MAEKSKHVLTLVSGRIDRAKIQVSKKTEDLVVRDIVKALKGLTTDHYVYAQEHLQEGETIGHWVRTADELRASLCKSLIDMANKCEDLAVSVGECAGGKPPKKPTDRIVKDLATMLVGCAGQIGQLQGLMDGKPKG